MFISQMHKFFSRNFNCQIAKVICSKNLISKPLKIINKICMIFSAQIILF